MSKRFKRSSGVLMPIFSLPSKYGIGTIGKAAYDFVDFLHASGQKYWQILPLGHTGFGDSPYQTFSTVAGNPYLIDLDILVKNNLLRRKDLPPADFESTRVNYEELKKTKFEILHKAFLAGKEIISDKIEFFVKQNSDWLIDYSMFMAIKDHFGQKPIWEWDDSDIKKRTPESIEHYASLLKEDIDFYIFMQYVFFEQWQLLKAYANNNGIEIIGDIPIYPSADSSDVWVNPELFKVDENLLPLGIAGVPPDIYSETGQMWGNPVYNWEAHKSSGFHWWIKRIENTLNFADVLRIDHFRGLCDYWEIPQGESTAINGKWMPGPQMDLFNAIKNALGDVPIIAEDLGIITDNVREFLKETGYPGMRVFIFGLSAKEDNMYLPHNWEVNSVGYTSTHDSETFKQKVRELSEEDRAFALQYIRASSVRNDIGMQAIQTAFASAASIVIVPIQDLLSLDIEGRINIPSTIGNNWRWRLSKGALTKKLANKLLTITRTYKR